MNDLQKFENIKKRIEDLKREKYQIEGMIENLKKDLSDFGIEDFSEDGLNIFIQTKEKELQESEKIIDEKLQEIETELSRYKRKE